MITTVTLNPAIDREYFVSESKSEKSTYIYNKEDVKVFPGGKGLITAIDLKNLGHPDVQNIGFVGGRQGLFFEKMVQRYNITTNYIYTEDEIRNNVFIVSKSPVTYTQYNDYTYKVRSKDMTDLIKRFKRGITESDLIIIAGSIPEGVNFSIYQQLINICNQQGKEVYLQASGEALNMALQEQPKIVVPYFKHTKKILNEEVRELKDYLKMGKILRERGARYVILPYHQDRLIFIDDKIYSLSPKGLNLTSWLGASDAYNAAFFDYIYSNTFDFLEANRYASAAALSVAEKRSVFVENRAEIESNLNRIAIKEIRV